MTINIEKVEQEFDNWFDPNDGQNYWDCWLAAVMFAEAHSAKVLEDKEREIAELKTTVRSDNSKVIAALNANINDLREKLETALTSLEESKDRECRCDYTK